MSLLNLPTTLRGLAATTSGTSAFAAYPVASDMFGSMTGGVIVFASAAVIFAGWHYVGTEKGTDESSLLKRTGAGIVAVAFAAAMVAGIYASAQQQIGINTRQAAQQADTLYQQQETARIRNLDKLTEELRVTKKKTNPTEYARLQDEISRLSTPTPRTPTATQKSTMLVPVEYKWAIASVFELITPALLILAGLFARRDEKTAGLIAVDHPDQPGDQLPINPDNDPDPIDVIAERGIPANEEGHVTAANVVQFTRCSNRQARNAIAEAVTHGYLVKTGTGGATRYQYPQPQRLFRSVK